MSHNILRVFCISIIESGVEQITVLMNNPYIKLKEKLNKADYDDISRLQEICMEADKTALKLELDYKLNRSMAVNEETGSINEFMYYDEDRLLGYVGIGRFGGSAMEVNGMVHPDYRRRGIFKKLFSLVKDEWRRGELPEMLLLCDAGAAAGHEFIKTTDAGYHHSEYEMYLRDSEAGNAISERLHLRKATNGDAREISRQNSVYFDIDLTEVDEILPEEEEKCGMHIYMAELDGKIIGKIHLDTGGGVYGIYGLGVLPEYRGKGYGREILLAGIKLLKSMGDKDIMLQVYATNRNALELYRSCGFEETSTMEYYSMNKKADS